MQSGTCKGDVAPQQGREIRLHHGLCQPHPPGRLPGQELERWVPGRGSHSGRVSGLSMEGAEASPTQSPEPLPPGWSALLAQAREELVLGEGAQHGQGRQAAPPLLRLFTC